MRFHPVERLLNRLARPEREVVFVVGSALTASAAGVPGVPGVRGVTDRVVAEVETRLGPVEAARLRAEIDRAGGRAYQTAFDFLGANCGPEAANRVIRDAVLTAHRDPPAVRTPAALRALEDDPGGWHLPPAVKALGHVLAHGGERFRAPVLTTNFDPLVEVAIRAAGGQAVGLAQLDDAALPAAWGPARHVVHLHGHWLSDTWHTDETLRLDRRRLKRSLARLLDGRIVVALGYGGWQDALMAALAEVAADVEAKPQVLWGFYGDTPGESPVTAALRPLGPRATLYAGIDVHRDLPRLRARLNGECAQIGRSALCKALLGALGKGHAVEIVGEPNMKRSRLLLWLEAQARALGRRTVRVNAGELARKTPEALLRAIAEKDGRADVMSAALTERAAMPDAADAARCLPLLDGLLILIDNADALAGDGNGFTAAFFDAFRARMQAVGSDVQWVSVSRWPLERLFRLRGWTSQFLSDAEQHWAGGLNVDEAMAALRVRLGDELARRGAASAGTIPRLVYRLCEAEHRDPQAALDGLAAWSAGMFALWWRRATTEQAVLKAAVGGVDEEELSDAEREIADDLCRRGLLVETADGFALNGALWETYVRRAG